MSTLPVTPLTVHPDQRSNPLPSRGGGAVASTSNAPTSFQKGAGSTLLNSTDPFYKEFRDLPYHIAIQVCVCGVTEDSSRVYVLLRSRHISTWIGSGWGARVVDSSLIRNL